ncbi:substrate-binding domain-containing protein [Alloyangia pacifica]|uniref:Amino acid ABC transporter substrate-binding protein, PAAT family (TC 3.A.1.3.-) n=1 Tax=Alloyangia pacifica TaxID=311180 RepID=A0A1I6VF58_9RHOB|nr:substrate-binding domain-containing protein [Alloyangia pacifica]SDH95046.1 amino acid ABC transporter substrate-binding protein, PAAT family (TC 3.A.1.3.-) [Alloyangia pacifica]SFT12346.1 amino acid ABC transporter substrate-binding protein, PAAT family (TC 3.A.1.3.-) [Alloyangia pacifica]
MPAWAEAVRGAALALLLAGTAGAVQAQTSDLVSKTQFRVCADPAADPMSMQDGSGYENKLAELFAAKLERPVSYTWFPMATGFIRQTLKAGKCDVVMGYAQGHELVLNTNHYMTSAYALVVPSDGPLAGVNELSDPALQGLTLGVIAGSPPATHMARHGLIGKARAYALVVDRRVESPASDMLDDLAAGEIDAAVLWGPIAGPLVERDHPGLKVVPLIREAGAPKLFYRITMGVRRGEKVWQRQLNSLIRRNKPEIDALLAEAGVPLLDDMGERPLDVGQ